jgi:hypothetical protein
MKKYWTCHWNDTANKIKNINWLSFTNKIVWYASTITQLLKPSNFTLLLMAICSSLSYVHKFEIVRPRNICLLIVKNPTWSFTCDNSHVRKNFEKLNLSERHLLINSFVEAPRVSFPTETRFNQHTNYKVGLGTLPSHWKPKPYIFCALSRLFFFTGPDFFVPLSKFGCRFNQKFRMQILSQL